MYRVELKVELPDSVVFDYTLFLMYRVELKVGRSYSTLFLPLRS